MHWSLLPRPGTLLKLPSGHGRGAEARSSQKDPAAHLEHALSPLAFMNLPAMHCAHAPCPVCGCTVPGAQGVATAAPVEQKEPLGQMAQLGPTPVSE